MKHDWVFLPEIHDLVSVEIKQVDYYGYVNQIDPDWKSPRIQVEFHPLGGGGFWFGLDELKPVEYPKEKD